MSALQAGTKAPDFSLHTTPDQAVGLHEFRGRRLILAFYPADWSPVCSDQMSLYEVVRPEFQRHGAELLGISVDGVWCHLTFAKDRKIHYPLLSDFEPKGEVSRAYGVYIDERGHNQRALVMIGPDLRVRWAHRSPSPLEIPGANLIFDALASQNAAA